MKAKLKYKLPKDQYDFDRAIKGGDMADMLSEYSQYLRGQLKYQDVPDDLEKATERFYEILNDHDLNLDKLVQ